MSQQLQTVISRITQHAKKGEQFWVGWWEAEQRWASVSYGSSKTHLTDTRLVDKQGVVPSLTNHKLDLQ